MQFSCILAKPCSENTVFLEEKKLIPKGIPKHAEGFPHHQSAAMPFSLLCNRSWDPCLDKSDLMCNQRGPFIMHRGVCVGGGGAPAAPVYMGTQII